MPGEHLQFEDRIKLTGKENRGTSIINSIKNRVHCNEKCRIFWICPLMPLSISRQNVDTACLLNKGGNALIRRFVNVFVTGEEGLKNEIDQVLYSYGIDIETAPPGIKKDYVTMLMNWHKQQYSDKQIAMESKPNLTVVINEMHDGRMIQVPIIPVLEAGGIHNSKNDVILDGMVRGIIQDDPESLLGSPIAEELLKRKVPKAKSTGSAEARGTKQDARGRFRKKEGYIPIKEREKEGENVSEQSGTQTQDVKNVSKPDSRTQDDEPVGVEREPEELEKTSVSTGSGS